MKIVESERHDTTIFINQTIINLCEQKKSISLKGLMRSTFQFILAVDLYCEDNINIVLDEIFFKYDPTIYKQLCKNGRKIKTYITKNQKIAYQKIKYRERKINFNKLMSIAINNTSYSNVIHLPLVKNDFYINMITIDFFTNPFLCEKTIIIILESIISKINYSLKNNLVTESYYNNIIIDFIDDYTIINDFQIFKFLFKEFKKIYFAILILYKINMNEKSSTGLAREVMKQYKTILHKKYENKIENFIINEIQFKEDINFEEQKEFFQLLHGLFKSRKEKILINEIIIEYMSVSKYFIGETHKLYLN